MPFPRRERRDRAFTLIEVMVVVVLVGVLATLAAVAYRKWVRNSYVGEAQGMLSNIRTAEESFRAENSGYLMVSNDLSQSSLYPSATPTEAFVTEWGAACGNCVSSWTALNVNPNAPVRFGYAVIADATGNGAVALPVIKVAGVAQDLSPMSGQPWYVAVAMCDLDNDSTTPSTTIYATSGSNRFISINEGQ